MERERAATQDLRRAMAKGNRPGLVVDRPDWLLPRAAGGGSFHLESNANLVYLNHPPAEVLSGTLLGHLSLSPSPASYSYQTTCLRLLPSPSPATLIPDHPQPQTFPDLDRCSCKGAPPIDAAIPFIAAEERHPLQSCPHDPQLELEYSTYLWRIFRPIVYPSCTSRFHPLDLRMPATPGSHEHLHALPQPFNAVGDRKSPHPRLSFQNVSIAVHSYAPYKRGPSPLSTDDAPHLIRKCSGHIAFQLWALPPG
ncbi:uncharacterized protein BO80DRAFT_99465 [Aspergillus ibericus CBS 121593]|uniref:Uncharacterized protein n=1 Tax=Aspergillus ibericus CBS 121593 TaxID=1448316 RepID=A0A395H0K7_9EURO|nr:hypothetical protein BO80DRAFT_99465 [Aspergillus ibericus CBS 121593]RAL00478.1 hypothetical protein BO80DRAFT_99465 [Aspergillus ibericus CBS 121593]